jgi:hypothetical protein
MPATKGNARGYFESVPFMQFHEQLLQSAGSAWNDWRAFNPDWSRSAVASEFRERAKELFWEEFEGSPLPVLKDPRTCRFAPFWFETLRELEAIPRVVIPIRSPLEAARSLAAREGLSLTHGVLLWLRHVLAAEADSRNEIRSIFMWKDFVSDWRAIADKISKDTELAWPRLSDRASRDIERFLSRELVHEDVDDKILFTHPDVHEWAARTFEAFQELARNPMSNSARATLDEVRGLLDQSGQLFGRLLIDYEVELEELRVETQAVKSERDSLSAASASFDSERNLRSQELAERVAAASELVRLKEQAERDLEALAAEREALREANAALGADLRNREDELRRINELLAEKETSLSQLIARLEQAERDRDLAKQEIEAVRLTNSDLTSELRSRDEEVAKQAASISGLAIRAERERLAASQDRAALDRSLSETIAERDALRDRISELNAELQLRHGELIESASVAAKLASAQEQLEQKASEVDRLTAQLEESSARIASDGESLSNLSAQLSQREEQLEATRAESETLAAEMDRERELFRQHRAALNAELDKSLAEQAALRELNARLKADLHQSIRDVSEQAASFGERLADSRRAAESAARKHESLGQGLNAAVAERDALRNANSQLSEEVQRLRIEIAESAQALGRHATRAEQAQTAREQRLSEVVIELEQVKKESAGLASERAELANELKQLRAEKQNLVANMNQLSRELTGVRDSANVSRSEQNAAHFSVVAAERSAFESRLAELESELAEVETALGKARSQSKPGALLPWNISARHKHRRTARQLLKCGLFDAEFYRKTYFGKQNGSGDPAKTDDLALATHYLEEGAYLGFLPNPLFDTKWYLEKNKDVRLSGHNPLLHYLLHGVREGRDPAPTFSTQYYLQSNPDVRSNGMNPLLHYLRFGRHEGRLAMPPA